MSAKQPHNCPECSGIQVSGTFESNYRKQKPYRVMLHEEEDRETFVEASSLEMARAVCCGKGERRILQHAALAKAAGKEESK